MKKFVITLALGALFLVGCGSSEDNSTPKQTSSPESEITEAYQSYTEARQQEDWKAYCDLLVTETAENSVKATRKTSNQIFSELKENGGGFKNLSEFKGSTCEEAQAWLNDIREASGIEDNPDIVITKVELNGNLGKIVLGNKSTIFVKKEAGTWKFLN